MRRVVLICVTRGNSWQHLVTRAARGVGLPDFREVGKLGHGGTELFLSVKLPDFWEAWEVLELGVFGLRFAPLVGFDVMHNLTAVRIPHAGLSKNRVGFGLLIPRPLEKLQCLNDPFLSLII